MTSLTTVSRARGACHMLRVIKLHIEALIETRRKRFQRRGGALYIAMANDAHRDIRSYKLCQMALCAGGVSGKLGCSAIVCARVTGVASQRGMTLASVHKL